jgi:transglutaminase-like putative cysteine protease
MTPRLLPRPGVLLLVRFVPTVTAALVLALTSATAALPALARSGALLMLVVSVLVAVIPKRANVKIHGAVIFAVLAVALSGLARTGLPYQVGCAVFALVCLACLRAPLVAERVRAATLDRGETELATVRARREQGARGDGFARMLPLAILVVVGAVVASSLIVALPPASAYVERQVQRYAGDAVLRNDDRMGFATNIRVGALNHMLQSDRVVMRLEGEAPELLRGAVLDAYDRRIWSSTRSKTRVSVTTDAPIERSTTRIELSRAALSGNATEPRWFIPGDACDLRTPSGVTRVDPYGSAHPEPASDARGISFRRTSSGDCQARLPTPEGPEPVDVDLAEKIRRELRPIALEWTRGTRTTQASLEAIALHLASFEYALEDRHETRVDPIVEFLTVHRRGHCELFASAMALLARSVGIPARIVVGYRVDETNAFTGLAVVRDRNAHSWVEAWVGDRWMTFDPTPLAELHATTRATPWNHVSEAVSFAWDRTVNSFVRLGLLGTGIMFAVAAVVLTIIRYFTQTKRRATRVESATSRPLPAFETLSSALSEAGFVRSSSEPLERFARRVRSAGEPWAAEVAELLVRYAELRYGGIGEEHTVAVGLDTMARKVLGARPALASSRAPRAAAP